MSERLHAGQNGTPWRFEHNHPAHDAWQKAKGELADAEAVHAAALKDYDLHPGQARLRVKQAAEKAMEEAKQHEQACLTEKEF